MKKISFILLLVLFLTLFTPQVAYANMAAPKKADIGSTITFEKNSEVSVLSETLNITVDGLLADIVATYRMKNTTNESISTPSMFISPNIENDVKVVVNDKYTTFTVETYALDYSSKIVTNAWQYVVLADKKADSNEEQTVSTITFEMDFAPNEEYDVVVSYRYSWGGYLNNYAKEGVLKYYLKPAAMWKDFSNLTINLYLDKDMPIVKSSNLKFEKAGRRTYQYVSNELPQEDLDIIIGQNWWQSSFSALRSPYLYIALMVYLPYILVFILILAVVIFIICYLRKKKKQKGKNEG